MTSEADWAGVLTQECAGWHKLVHGMFLCMQEQVFLLWHLVRQLHGRIAVRVVREPVGAVAALEAVVIREPVGAVVIREPVGAVVIREPVGAVVI